MHNGGSEVFLNVYNVDSRETYNFLHKGKSFTRKRPLETAAFSFVKSIGVSYETSQTKGYKQNKGKNV